MVSSNNKGVMENVLLNSFKFQFKKSKYIFNVTGRDVNDHYRDFKVVASDFNEAAKIAKTKYKIDFLCINSIKLIGMCRG